MVPSETPKSLQKNIYYAVKSKTGQTKNTGKPAEPEEEEERRRPIKQDITENKRMQRKPRS